MSSPSQYWVCNRSFFDFGRTGQWVDLLINSFLNRFYSNHILFIISYRLSFFLRYLLTIELGAILITHLWIQRFVSIFLSYYFRLCLCLFKPMHTLGLNLALFPDTSIFLHHRRTFSSRLFKWTHLYCIAASQDVSHTLPTFLRTVSMATSILQKCEFQINGV